MSMCCAKQSSGRSGVMWSNFSVTPKPICSINTSKIDAVEMLNANDLNNIRYKIYEFHIHFIQKFIPTSDKDQRKEFHLLVIVSTNGRFLVPKRPQMFVWPRCNKYLWRICTDGNRKVAYFS